MASRDREEQGCSGKLFSSTAGYYEHGKGARYINPIASGATFPDLVELHESAHAYLSLANSTDGVARIFAGVLEWGNDALLPGHKRSIEGLFQNIHENTTFTQELYATYISFLQFASRNPQHVPRARHELPRFYKTVLTEAESVFGPVEAGTSTIVLVNACAIAAMNVRYPNAITFDDIDILSDLVVTNSPDARFRRILQTIRSYGHNELLSRSCIDQAAVFKWLQSYVSDVEFFIFSENTTYFRNWAACLIRDAVRFGYGFLEDKAVIPHPEDSEIERMGASLELPGMEPWEPLDLSLKYVKFASGSLGELLFNGQACASAAIGLFVHIFLLPHENLARLVAFAWSSTKTALVTPFAATCPIDELLSTLKEVPRGGIVLKIDERMGEQTACRLAATGHPCFVLAHDTRPKHVVEVVRDAVESQEVQAGILYLEDNFGVLLFQMVRDGYCFLAPSSHVGIELIERTFSNSCNFIFPDNEDELLTALRIDRQRLYDLCYTCYGIQDA